MLQFAWLFWWMCGGVTVGGPVKRLPWLEGVNPIVEIDGGRPPFYRLPMFQHAPGHLVAPELLHPLPRQRPIPAELTALLLPSTSQELATPGTGTRAVEVRCGADDISVRVDRLQLSAWTVASLFRVGSCPANRITGRFLFFNFRLTECDGESQVVGGQLVYTYTLCYTPPPQGSVTRVLPFNLPIQCQYNRFHYSYQVGFRPQVQHTTFLKRVRSKLSVSLTVCNAQWEPLPPDHGFYLGEPMYFVAQTRALLAGERLYVDSCYATDSKDPDSMPRVDIITNYGCMTDSQREGSKSWFWSGGESVLKFSVDTFLFKEVSQVQFLHCSMSVGVTTSQTSKTCNYNQTTGRWEDLDESPSVCSCCDSMCADTQDSVKNMVSSPGWLTKQKDEGGAKMSAISFQAEEGREEVDQEEERGESVEEHLKKLHNISQEAEIDLKKKEEAISETSVHPANETDLSLLTAGSRHGMKDQVEETEVLMEQTDGRLTPDGIMSDQIRNEEHDLFQDNDNVSSSRMGPVSVLSSENGNITSTESSGTDNITTINSSFRDEDSAENVSVSNSSAAHSTMNTTVSAESFPPDGAVPPLAEPNLLVSDTNVHESPGRTNFDMDSPVFDRQTSDSSRGSNESGTLQWSEDSQTSNRSVGRETDRIPEQAGDSSSEELDGGDPDMLHSLQIRGLQLDWSAHPARFGGPICVDESDCDSGIEEGKVLHSQFIGAVRTKTEPELFGVGSGSERLHQDGPIRSAVSTIITTEYDPESSHMTDRDLQSLRFLLEHPAEAGDGWKQKEADSFYVEEMNRRLLSG